MFKFTTTTIINSDTDLHSDKALFSSIAAEGVHGATLRILRDFTFEMPGIKKVYKKEGYKPTYAEITIDCDKLLESLPSDVVYPASGRIALYIALEGSEESVFANDFYQKGMPFAFGFLVKDADVTGAQLANGLKFEINRFNVATVGRRIFDVSVSDAVLTFKCHEEYSRFQGVVALLDTGYTETELVHYHYGEDEEFYSQDVITLVERGTNGFGTYRHLLKDIKLPSSLNTNWTALKKTEAPVPGALYDQYIVYYEAPSGTNPSLVAVGDTTSSKTAHVFWVRQDYSEAFQTVVSEVVGSDPVKDDPTAIFEEV